MAFSSCETLLGTIYFDTLKKKMLLKGTLAGLSFTLVIACAFIMLFPSRPVHLYTEKSLEAYNRPPESPPVQDSDLETKVARASRPMESSSDSEVQTESDFLGKIRDWTRRYPEAALAWAQQQPNNQERDEALTEACFQIAQTDPKRAVLLAEHFNLSQDGVLENLAQQWAAKNLSTASSWITTQPADGRRDALATGVAFIWSQTQPAGAAEFVMEQIRPGLAQNGAILMVLHQWAMLDPNAADAWAQQFPESPLRDQALHELSGIAQYKQGTQ